MAYPFAVLTLSILVLAASGCGDSMPAGPTPPGPGPTPAPTPSPVPTPAPLALTFTDPVRARLVTCAACTLPPFLSVVAEFPVTIGDPAGPGGTVQSVETRVVNRSRGSDAGRNTRPNGDFGYSNTTLPAGGSLTLDAGVVFDMQPPRDDLQIVVVVLLADGRSVERAAAITATGP